MNCKKCGKEIPENMEYCAECAMQNALESVEIPENNKKPVNKKIILAVCVAVIITIGVSIALILIMDKNKTDSTDEPTSVNDEEIISTYTDDNGETQTVRVNAATTVSSALPAKNGTTVASGKTVDKTAPATNPNKIGNEVKDETINVNNKVQSALSSFFNGKFYFTANMYTNDSTEGTRMTMAINGDNLEGIMYDSSMTMGIMQLDGKTYFFNPNSKKYIEFTEEIAETLGISTSDMNLGNFSEIFGKQLTPIAQYETTINGKAAVCYEFESQKGSTKFYFINDTLTEIDQYDSSGTLETEFAVEAFSGSIPSDMLTLTGLKKAKSLVSLMS